jgi:hypothetical protein
MYCKYSKEHEDDSSSDEEYQPLQQVGGAKKGRKSAKKSVRKSTKKSMRKSMKKTRKSTKRKSSKKSVRKSTGKKYAKSGMELVPKGSLVALGYSSKNSAEERKKSLKKAVGKYGKANVVHKLEMLSKLQKKNNPKSAKVFQADSVVAKKL